MGILREIFLGILQGITGFLPVSSSGHVILFGNIFGLESEYITFLVSLLKISSLMAVFIVLFKDIMKIVIGAYQLIVDVFSNIVIFFKKNFGKERDGYYVLDSNPYKKLVLMLIVSTFFTYLLAIFLGSIAKNIADIPIAMGICFIISGLLFALTEGLRHGKRTIKNMSSFDAAIIGVAQGISVMPGISRVVMTYSMAVALGYSKSYAFKYSCFLSIPSIIGSAMLNLQVLEGTAISFSNLANILAAMVVCGVLSCLFLKIMLNMVKKGSAKIFSVYGIVLGIVIVIVDLII